MSNAKESTATSTTAPESSNAAKNIQTTAENSTASTSIKLEQEQAKNSVDISQHSTLLTPHISSNTMTSSSNPYPTPSTPTTRSASALKQQQLQTTPLKLPPLPQASPATLAQQVESIDISKAGQSVANAVASGALTAAEYQLTVSTPIICRGNLPKNAVEELRNWLFDHFQYPYPSDAEKEQLMQKTSMFYF